MNAATRASGATPLHRAAYAGHLDVVSMLVDAGAETSTRDRDGETALHKVGQIATVCYA